MLLGPSPLQEVGFTNSGILGPVLNILSILQKLSIHISIPVIAWNPCTVISYLFK